MRLTTEAQEAYNKGVQDGTITDTVQEVMETVLNQEVVTYCSAAGCITFDYMDIEEEL